MDAPTLHRRLAGLMGGVAVAGLVVAATFVVLPGQGSHSEGVDYGYVYSGAKSSSVPFVSGVSDQDTLLVLGSSEFSTPATLVPQVPAQTFGQHNRGIRLMLVGEAFDQCLWDAIALGAFASDGLARDKVALIVGLGQFTDGGLDASTFATRFSYSLYEGFCKNPRIGEELRSYVGKRLGEQGVDEVTLRAASRADVLGDMDALVLGAMDDLRLRRDLTEVRKRGVGLADGALEETDWAVLRAEALEVAMSMSTTNEWGLEDDFYTKQLEPALEGLSGARSGETYTDTPEYEDLDCFLSVCDACGVEPLIIVQPSCGPYYDHIGISREVRAGAYERIRETVARHEHASLADFSDREYERYFLFDIVHFGWTGWIDAEQALFEFWNRA